MLRYQELLGFPIYEYKGLVSCKGLHGFSLIAMLGLVYTPVMSKSFLVVIDDFLCSYCFGITKSRAVVVKH